MERMEERVIETVYDPLQYFLSDSNWDWHPVNDQIARDCDKMLGGYDDRALYIDETRIPKDQIVFKTKHEQALEVIFCARKNGVRFKWVGFNGFYGDNPKFLRTLADNGEEFMAEDNYLMYNLSRKDCTRWKLTL
jgi:SRSO17 transposase